MYRVRAFAVAVRARGHVILYADNVYIHYVDRHVRFVPSSRSQHTLRRESQQRSNAVGLAKVYSVCTFNLASHRVVVCAERNRVFSTLTIIIISVIVVDVVVAAVVVVVVIVVVVVVVVTMHYVNGFKCVAVRIFP